MNKKRMVIFDQDETYAGSLMEYLESMQNFPYTISVFVVKDSGMALFESVSYAI